MRLKSDVPTADTSVEANSCPKLRQLNAPPIPPPFVVGPATKSIRVIVSRAMKASIFDGRGTSLSEGGMALFAGAELRWETKWRSNLPRRFLRPRYGWKPKSAIGPDTITAWSF